MGLLLKILLTPSSPGILPYRLCSYAVVGVQPPLVLSFHPRGHNNWENQPITLLPAQGRNADGCQC